MAMEPQEDMTKYWVVVSPRHSMSSEEWIHFEYSGLREGLEMSFLDDQRMKWIPIELLFDRISR